MASLARHDLRARGSGLRLGEGNKLKMEVVGLDCTDYSSRGGRKRARGKSSPSVLTYLARIRQEHPHIVIVEEAPEFIKEGL
eukprot:10913519-Alexandrium_andersonii.AAC.1